VGETSQFGATGVPGRPPSGRHPGCTLDGAKEALPDPTPESHWYPSDVERQPPLETVTSLRRLVQEAGGRLGPGADIDTVLRDLRSRKLDVTRDEVNRVWDALA